MFWLECASSDEIMHLVPIVRKKAFGPLRFQIRIVTVCIFIKNCFMICSDIVFLSSCPFPHSFLGFLFCVLVISHIADYHRHEIFFRKLTNKSFVAELTRKMRREIFFPITLRNIYTHVHPSILPQCFSRFSRVNQFVYHDVNKQLKMYRQIC